MKRELILMVALLIFSANVCTNESDGYTAIDRITCGTLVKTCDHTETIIMAGVKDLKQNVSEHTRFYRWRDCALDEWHTKSCSATCTIEIR